MKRQHELLKSFLLGVAAIVLLIVWLSLHPKPPQLRPQKMIGEKLFPTFTDPMMMKSVSIERPLESGQVESIKLVREKGGWQLASYYHFPAENADQMAVLVSSLLQLTVLAVQDEVDMNRSGKEVEESFAQWGLLETNQPSPVEQRATRVVIAGQEGEALVDLLVGNQLAESSASREVRYVRPPQWSTILTVDFTPSTLDAQRGERLQPFGEIFSTNPFDWIQKEILRISRWNVRQLAWHGFSLSQESNSVVNNVNESRLIPGNYTLLLQDPTNSLQRAWSAARIETPDATGRYRSQGERSPEEVQNDRVNDAVEKLVRLDLSEVIAKPPSLKSLLLLGGSLRELIGQDEWIKERGFALLDFNPIEPDATEPFLVGEGGIIEIGLKEGVVLKLVFGAKQEENRQLWVVPACNRQSLTAQEPLPLQEIPAEATPEERKILEAQNSRIADENLIRQSEWELALAGAESSVRILAERFSPWIYLINESDYQKIFPKPEEIIKQ